MSTKYIYAPKECDLCHCKIDKIFYDIRTKMGYWANTCPNCFESYGVGLGLGRGQKYVRDDSEDYIKVKG